MSLNSFFCTNFVENKIFELFGNKHLTEVNSYDIIKLVKHL